MFPYSLGDSERFSGFYASLLNTDYAVPIIATKTRWRMHVAPCLSFEPNASFRRKEELSGPITASGEALDVLNYFR